MKTEGETGVISARISKERIRTIEEVAREERIDKSTVIDRALEQYAKTWKLKRAIEQYKKGKITLSRAAEMAEISVWEMIDALAEEKVPLQYSLEDLKEDLKTLSRLKK